MLKIILKCLMENDEYFRKIINFFKKEYIDAIEDSERVYSSIFDIIKNYHIKYNKKPNYEILNLELLNLDIDEEKIDKIKNFLKDLKKARLDHEENIQYYIDKTEEYAQDVYFKKSLLESLSLIKNNDNGIQDRQAARKLVNDALSLSINKNVGHDYFQDTEKRYEFYHKEIEKIPTDIDVLNTMLNGGFPRGTLNIWIASTNIGKCGCKNTKIKIRNKKTGKIQEINFKDFFNKIKKKKNK